MASRFLFLSAALLVLVTLAFAHFGREVHGGNGVLLPPPPPTKVEPVTDTLHGKKITDDYRWLEDGQSPETRAWIASQMEYTEKYLSQVKIRPEIARRLSELQRVETIDVLEHPELADEYRILTTPTVVRVAPPPRRRVTGDLRDAELVMAALGLSSYAPNE